MGCITTKIIKKSKTAESKQYSESKQNSLKAEEFFVILQPLSCQLKNFTGRTVVLQKNILNSTILRRRQNLKEKRILQK